MDVADQIVLMNHGQVEQAGGPRELYENPANEFVMGFVGPVNRIGESFVRPHDFELLLQPNGDGAQEAMVFANPRQFFRPPYVGPRGSYQMVARTMKRRGRGCA